MQTKNVHLLFQKQRDCASLQHSLNIRVHPGDILNSSSSDTAVLESQTLGSTSLYKKA